MSMETYSNGRSVPRRTLNDSIARLDQILDGLGEAIPAAIKETLQDSIGVAIAEGVKAALIEVLSHPEVIQRMQAKPAGTTSAELKPATPTLLQRIKAKFRPVTQTVSSTTTMLNKHRKIVVRNLRWIGDSPKVFGVAAGVGLVVALITYCSSPFVASTIAGIAGSVSTLGIQFGMWVKRTMGRMLLAD